MPSMTRYSYKRRVAAGRSLFWFKVFWISEVAIGGLSGVLIAALLLEWRSGPGHPFYVSIRAALAAVFGVE